MKFSEAELAGLADKSTDAYSSLFEDGSINQPENQALIEGLDEEVQRLIAINVVRHCPADQLNSLTPQTQNLLRTPSVNLFAQKLQDAYHVHNRINVITDKPHFAHKAWIQNFRAEAFHANADFASELLGDDTTQQKKANSLAETTPRTCLYDVMNNVRSAFPDISAETATSKATKHSFTQHVKRALQAADHIDSLASCKEDSELVSHLEKLSKHFATYPDISKRLSITSRLEEVAKRIAGMDIINRTAACSHLEALSPKQGSNIFAHIADWVKKNIPAEQAHEDNSDSDRLSHSRNTSSQSSAAADSPKSVNPGRVKCGIFGGCSTSEAKDDGAYYSDSDTEEEKKGSCFGWGGSKAH